MQLSMSVTESGIRSDFLNPVNYKATLEFASKRNDSYLKFCRVIQKYYADLYAVSSTVGERVRVQQGGGLLTINQIKQFLLDFMGILEEVSRFKMGFYEQLQDVEEDPVKKPTYDMLANISKYYDLQTKYKDIYKKLASVEKHLEEQFLLLKKETKEPVNYFSFKQNTVRCNELETMMKEREQLQKDGNEMLDSIYKNSELFQKEIMFYRQKMLSGKYKVHQKLREMSKGAKECLVQTLLTLLQLVDERRRAFQLLNRESWSQNSLLQKFQKNIKFSGASEEMKLTEIIIQATQEYKMLIDDLDDFLKNLSECFLALGTSTKDNNECGRPVIEELNKLYENEENPTPELIEALDLFYFFCQKLGDIPNRIHILQANLGKLKQNINKHSEITLSLVRCGNINRSRGQNKGLDQIGHLFEQLSYDFINDIIQKLYKEFEGTLGNMKNHFNEKFYKKKKKMVQDSMQISHIEEYEPLIEKRPSKKEMWIWKDFRNAEKYHKLCRQPKILKEVLKDVQNFKQAKCEGGKEIEKYNCSVKFKKEIKGVLCIYEKTLGFSAANNSLDLTIPYEFVEQVVASVNIFQKELTIKTSVGDVVFLHFPEISRAEVLIQQQMEAQSSKQVIVQKISVELSEEEKAFIAQRRAKVEEERPSIEGMQQKGSVILQNTSIDTVYDIIYSDKPFKHKGKEEASFMAFISKKNKASNYSTTPYSPTGPHFYSGQEGNTFLTSGLFSQRTTKYQVPLPPIPFMPKTCITNEQVKLFWISNQQFDYSYRVDTRGAPMSDSFYMFFLHKVVQRDKSVEIKIYYKLTFVSEPALKGTIISKSDEQTSINIGIFVNEVKKIVRAGGGGSSKRQKSEEEGKTATADNDDEGSEQDRSVSNGKVQKLQNQNKILIGVLVVFILINIILKMW